MVRAALAGIKTETRLLKPRNIKVGDTIWILERAYISSPHFGGDSNATHRDDNGASRIVSYFADRGRSEAAEDYGIKLRSSILMPRWASRIQRVVTSVRIERLHDITEAGAIAEGIEIFKHGGFEWDSTASIAPFESDGISATSARTAFVRFWSFLHGQDSSRANPEVQVISWAEVNP
jgi:hypothetical protein